MCDGAARCTACLVHSDHSHQVDMSDMHIDTATTPSDAISGVRVD
jgi:hypothetical protein